jgi:hypothetical protein
MILRIRKGQSTLEYIIIFCIVIGVIIGAGVAFQPNIKAAYNAIYQK